MSNLLEEFPDSSDAVRKVIALQEESHGDTYQLPVCLNGYLANENAAEVENELRRSICDAFGMDVANRADITISSDSDQQRTITICHLEKSISRFIRKVIEPHLYIDLAPPS